MAPAPSHLELGEVEPDGGDGARGVPSVPSDIVRPGVEARAVLEHAHRAAARVQHGQADGFGAGLRP